MLSYYCCGCRASYPAQPKRCPRCKGRSFSAVDDDAPTRGLLDADPPLVVENLDGELAEAFAASERYRMHRLTGAPLERPAPAVVVLEGDDAPPTPRDMPEQS